MSKDLLSNYDRNKIDSTDDILFYSQPRFVYHLDIFFRNRLTKLYSSQLNPNSIVLDMMSSWVSHLPNLKFKKVIGHGMNIQELEANKRLDSFWNQDLNKNQILPLENSSVDYCLIVAGWQYLQFPELVSSEILRVLKPHGKFIISFSNRAFWNKSPNIWVNSDDQGRIDYISRVLKSVGWKIDSVIAEYLKGQSLFSLFKSQSDPFFSVIATKPSDL